MSLHPMNALDIYLQLMSDENIQVFEYTVHDNDRVVEYDNNLVQRHTHSQSLLDLESALESFIYAAWLDQQYVEYENTDPVYVSMSDNDIKTLQNVPFKELKKALPNCAICLDDFTPDDMNTVLVCNHNFHKSCIAPWITTFSYKCPICRADNGKEHKITNGTN